MELSPFAFFTQHSNLMLAIAKHFNYTANNQVHENTNSARIEHIFVRHNISTFTCKCCSLISFTVSSLISFFMICIDIHVDIFTHIHIHVCIYIYIYIDMKIYVYVCIHIYIYIYIYTHTCTCSSTHIRLWISFFNICLFCLHSMCTCK